MNIPDEITHHREVVKDIINRIEFEGGWEGQYVDLKHHFDLNPKNGEYSMIPFLKHILAFANTPRAKHAYVIFGISENKATCSFEVTGTEKFPNPTDLHNLIESKTNIPRDSITIDGGFRYKNMRIPYFAIDIEVGGPFRLNEDLVYDKKKVLKNNIYIRSGKKSIQAENYQIEQMKDWLEWIIDDLSIGPGSDIEQLIRSKIQNIKKFHKEKGYAKVLFEEESPTIISNTSRSLLYLYYSDERLNDSFLDTMRADPDFITANFRILISNDLPMDVAINADELNILTKTPKDFFHFNDAYSKYCYAFIDSFEKEIKDSRIGHLIDLKYKVGKNENNSIISYLFERITKKDVKNIIVKGDLGTGKTITAKFFTYVICKEYLNKRNSNHKVVYINLNGYNVRATNEDILRPIFTKLDSLSPKDINGLISDITNEKIILLLDSVDELHFPFGYKGFEEVKSFLQRFVNSSPIVQFLRSNYFKSDKSMIEFIGSFHFEPFSSENNNSVSVVNILPFEREQIEKLFISYFSEEEQALVTFKELESSDFKEILNDPLLLHYLLLFMTQDGLEISTFKNPSKYKHRYPAIKYIIEEMLKREFCKRKGQQKYFDQQFMSEFQNFLNRAAYTSIVSKSKKKFSLKDWDSHLESTLNRKYEDQPEIREQISDVFRTMAWIKRYEEENKYEFRHELINYICASQFLLHSLNSFSNYESLLLDELLKDENSYGKVIEFSLELATFPQIYEIIVLMQQTKNVKIIEVCRDIISKFRRWEEICDKIIDFQKDSNKLTPLVNFVIQFSDLADRVSPFFMNLSQHRKFQVILPLLVKLNPTTKPVSSGFLFKIVNELKNMSSSWFSGGYVFSFQDQLKYLTKSKEKDSYIDKMILKNFSISQKDIFDINNYQNIFSRLSGKDFKDQEFSKYIVKTLREFKV